MEITVLNSAQLLEVESGAVPCQTESSDTCGQIHQSDCITANRVGNGMQHQRRSLKNTAVDGSACFYVCLASGSGIEGSSNIHHKKQQFCQQRILKGLRDEDSNQPG
jgi:hypothetical protein